MTFFYDLNKRLATLASKQDATQLAESKQAETVAQSPFTQALNEAKADTIYVQHSNGASQKVKLTPAMKAAGTIYVTHPSGPQTKVKIPADAKKSVKEENLDEVDYSAKKAAAGKDIGKPGKNFAKIAKSAGARYGSKAAGERVAGAVLNKLRHAKEDVTDEGNAFTAALKATPKGGKFKVGGKEFTDTSDLEEGFKEMDAYMASREKEKGTGKFDKRITSTGTIYTRKPETFDDPETDPEATGGAPKRRGRPKGKDKGPERVTAKSYKYKIGRPTKTQEDLDSDGVMMTRASNMSSEDVSIADRSEYDQEGESAKHDIKTIVRHAQALHKILGDDDNLPEWVQSKLSKIEGMMIAVDEYMQNKDQEVSEAGKPDFLDLDKDGNKAEPMKKAAKEKKEEKVDETTVAGSVATAPAAAKKSAGGYNFGGGVYEGFNNQVENMITEGMSINISVDEQGKKSISVNATEQDAEALADLLKMAGLGGQGREESCPACNQAPCGCAEVVDENSPDYPTNTETSDNALQYSGGLNGPKSTGQTTVPVVASQLQRQASMEESVELERSLFKTWKNYKG